MEKKTKETPKKVVKKIKEKDKILLVHYINVEGMSPSQIDAEIQQTKDMNFEEGEDIASYCVPMKEGENRIECIDPKILPEEDYAEAVQSLERIKRLFEPDEI